MANISVVIVEDHQLVREMWSQLFSVRKDIEVVGKSGGFEEAIELIKAKRPDIVLLDINLPGASGMDAVPHIRKFASLHPAAESLPYPCIASLLTQKKCCNWEREDM
jgi:DNA-binding NarL/FixJ family response regulator